MKVKANRLGYYDHLRRKEGVIFDMKEDDYQPKDENGNPILDRKGKPRICSWVIPVKNAEKVLSEVQVLQEDEEEIKPRKRGRPFSSSKETSEEVLAQEEV